MNLKSLSISAIVAITGFLSMPAQAGTCWYLPVSVGDQGVDGEYCRTLLRTEDQLKVLYVTDGENTTHQYTFWDDNTVTHRVNGSEDTYDYKVIEDGIHRVYHADGFQFIVDFTDEL